jgi:hypothetical protein
MQYADGMSRGTFGKVPNRASFRIGRMAKFQPADIATVHASHRTTQIGSGERRTRQAKSKGLKSTKEIYAFTCPLYLKNDFRIDRKDGLLASEIWALTASLSE